MCCQAQAWSWHNLPDAMADENHSKLDSCSRNRDWGYSQKILEDFQNVHNGDEWRGEKQVFPSLGR